MPTPSKQHKPKGKAKGKVLSLPEPLPIPYESMIGHPVTEPILDSELMAQVMAAMVPFKNRVRWEQWGMHTIKAAGSAILLQGPSGTGKTTVARFIAKRVSQGIISITMADLGGSDPGETERNMRRVFDKGKEENNCTIFIDECDSILWSRDKAGPDSMWMLAVVNEALALIERYPGLVVLATNHAHVLDPALHRRLSDIITIGKPPFQVRSQLWLQKMPSDFPYDPSPPEISKLSSLELTGAEIENAIIMEAKLAIVQSRKPTFKSLYNIAKAAANTAQ